MLKEGVDAYQKDYWGKHNEQAQPQWCCFSKRINLKREKLFSSNILHLSKNYDRFANNKTDLYKSKFGIKIIVYVLISKRVIGFDIEQEQKRKRASLLFTWKVISIRSFDKSGAHG